MATPNNQITEIDPAQSDKVTTINAALTQLDNLLSAATAISVDADFLLTDTQQNNALGYVLSTGSVAAAFTMALQARSKLFFVTNSTTFTCTVEVDPAEDGADGDTVDVSAGDTALLYSDGTNIVEFTSSGGGGGVSTFLALTDTPSAFTGAGERFVKVNAAANALEFVEDSGSGGSGGGGGTFTDYGHMAPLQPPTTTEFSTSFTTTVAPTTTISDNALGLIMNAEGGGNDNIWEGRVKSWTPAVETHIFRMFLNVGTSRFPGGGFIIRDSSSGNFVAFGAQGLNNGDDVGWYADEFNNGGFSGNAIANPSLVGNFQSTWVRIDTTATGATMFVSFDGANFYEAGSITFADHVVSPDQIGFGVKGTSSTAGDTNLLYTFYSDDGTTTVDRTGAGSGSGAGSGGGYFGPFDPPTLTDFSTALALDNSAGTRTDDADRGLLIEATSSDDTGTAAYFGSLKSASEPGTGTDVYIMRMMTTPNTDRGGGGFVLRNSTNNRRLHFGFDEQLSTSSIKVAQWENNTFNANIFDQVAVGVWDLWFRVEIDAGGAVRFYLSSSGELWIQVASTTLATYIEASGGGSFDQIGFVARHQTEGGTNLVVPFYSEDGDSGSAGSGSGSSSTGINQTSYDIEDTSGYTDVGDNIATEDWSSIPSAFTANNITEEAVDFRDAAGDMSNNRYDITTRPGTCLFQMDGVAGNSPGFYADVTLAAGESYVAKYLVPTGNDVAEQAVQLKFGISPTGTTNFVLGSTDHVGLSYISGGTDAVCVFQGADASTESAEVAANHNGVIYFRITRSTDGNYYCMVSTDGQTWTVMAVQADSVTTGRIWVSVDANAQSDDAQPIVGIDWIRHVASEALDLW